MPIPRNPVRLLEEWTRTVDDYFKSCVEMQQLARLGDLQEFEKAESEARELKSVVVKARRRYKSNLRSSTVVGASTYFNSDARWPSGRRLASPARKSR